MFVWFKMCFVVGVSWVSEQIINFYCTKYGIGEVRIVQPVEMKGRLEEKIRALEKEKSMLLEEVRELKEVVELSERAKGLESEVDKLKSEVKTLRERLPREFLREIGEFVSEPIAAEEEEDNEECSSCEEEELL
jgi:hypothetical protein